jgi:hypothetical protein
LKIQKEHAGGRAWGVEVEVEVEGEVEVEVEVEGEGEGEGEGESRIAVPRARGNCRAALGDLRALMVEGRGDDHPGWGATRPPGTATSSRTYAVAGKVTGSLPTPGRNRWRR